MRLVSTVAEYQRLAKIEDHASRLQAWTADYEAAHPDVFSVYYSSYSDPSHRDSAVAEVARIAPLVRERETRAEALARKTEQEFRAEGLLGELNVVLLVGNHTANAWIEEFHGQQAMFVALELLGAASRELNPGQSDSGYLWNDDQRSPRATPGYRSTAFETY